MYMRAGVTLVALAAMTSRSIRREVKVVADVNRNCANDDRNESVIRWLSQCSPH